eukprot:TRINITY_DN67439_c0_g1_i2.p1 TRINITY_DN67439_c0_g1~~TRINITY_DN67439_c0_g1_i2.p1  ORF type:complete len:252 (+),score=-23.54 TRINITY_DN67439_c0_g1_i2:82-837(+)
MEDEDIKLEDEKLPELDLKKMASSKKEEPVQGLGMEHKRSKKLSVGEKEEEKKEKTKEEVAEEKKQQEKEDKLIMARLYTYNQPEKLSYYFGILLAACNGIFFPLSALVMSEMIWLLASYYTDPGNYREEANLYTYYFLMIAVGSLITYGGFMWLFGRVGEGLTYNLRLDCLNKIIRMPAGWFDVPENNAGTLAVRLASDAKLVNALTSNIIGIQINNTSAFITGMTIAFIYSWSITLVSLALSPFMVIAG